MPYYYNKTTFLFVIYFMMGIIISIMRKEKDNEMKSIHAFKEGAVNAFDAWWVET